MCRICTAIWSTTTMGSRTSCSPREDLTAAASPVGRKPELASGGRAYRDVSSLMPAGPPSRHQILALVFGGRSLRTLQDGDIQRVAPRHSDCCAGPGLDDVPRPIRGSEDRDVGLAVAVIIPRHRRSAPLPHCTPRVVPVPDWTMYHVPVDGRNTATSVLPSAS